MSQLYLPPIQPFHPATFVERGVAVPFTTPLLEGTRVRPAEKQGVELVVPNPSGGRGAYIVPWTGIASLCRPTLHDKVLNTRISALRGVTPATIRRVARAIAAEGLAGEEAMEAASVAANADKDALVITNYMLLVALVEQINLVPETAGDAPIAMERRAKMTTAWIAPHLNRSPTWVASALESLAATLGNIGVGKAKSSARIPRLFSQLRTTSEEIESWGQNSPEEDQASYARMITVVADFTLTIADTILGRAQSLTDDMTGLLRSWGANPDFVIHLVTRPEWLLDGWEQICLIWKNAADDASRRSAMAEIATLVPVIPKEVNDWCDESRDSDQALRYRRLVNLNEDWRSGATVFDLIARNEQFRAASC